jgi:hypothetical protein
MDGPDPPIGLAVGLNAEPTTTAFDYGHGEFVHGRRGRKRNATSRPARRPREHEPEAPASESPSNLRGNGKPIAAGSNDRPWQAIIFRVKVGTGPIPWVVQSQSILELGLAASEPPPKKWHFLALVGTILGMVQDWVTLGKYQPDAPARVTWALAGASG